MGQQKDVILKNEPDNLLILNKNCQKTNRNEPKNKADKLLKICFCGKNKPENEPTDVIEKT
jgi:hypothetical protein